MIHFKTFSPNGHSFFVKETETGKFSLYHTDEYGFSNLEEMFHLPGAAIEEAKFQATLIFGCGDFVVRWARNETFSLSDGSQVFVVQVGRIEIAHAFTGEVVETFSPELEKQAGERCRQMAREKIASIKYIPGNKQEQTS